MSRRSGDLIGAAELRRRFGWPSAFGATTYNELKGQEDGQPFSSDWMDMENDRIGFRIGAQARTFADVVNLAQHAIAEAIATAGKDRRGPIWRDPRFWGDDPGRQFGRLEDWVPSGPQPEGYEFAGPEHRFLANSLTPRQAEAATLSRPAETPLPEWTHDDVRAVMRSVPCSSGTDASRPIRHARVYQWFQRREAERVSGKSALTPKVGQCGGTAEVRAHTRQTARGPVRVAAHTRTVTCGR